MNKAFFFFVILNFALRLAGQTNEPVRLAVVSESAEVAAVSDVLTAQLSRNPQIHLLERSEINKVYREQQLSAGNRDYLKLGEILGADGLLLLGTTRENTNEFLQSRLVAVKTGVVLASERFQQPMGDPADWASGLARHLEPLLRKLTVGGRDAVPISVVNLRSAFQTPEERDFEHNLTSALIDRLTQERRVFVLERRRMESLSAEKELGGMDESAFWNGSYLLEGTIDREGYSQGKVTLSARLIPPEGRTPLPIEASGSRTNISEFIQQLTGKILGHLQIGSDAKPWTPADEAKRYEDEARWALRWKLYEAAQSASESAWALGKQDRDQAILRVRAYSESVWALERVPAEVGGPVAVQEPDPADFSPCIRALTLFCEGTPLVLTNAAQPDLDWFDTGLRAWDAAGSLVDGFYRAVEMRRGNEESLAELRAVMRRALPLLDEQSRQIRASHLPLPAGDKDYSPPVTWYNLKIIHDCDRLDVLEWNQACVCFEKPEDTLPFFRNMVETGRKGGNLPRIIGWSWEDRKRVPQVTKQFIGDLRESTNAGTRLIGLYFSVLRTPNDGTGSLEAAQGELFAGIWEQRTNLFSGAENSSVIAWTASALQNKYGDDLKKAFDREPFWSFRQKLRQDYITNALNWNIETFKSLFPPNAVYYGSYYTKEEAQNLLPKLQQLVEREPSNRAYRLSMNEVVREAGVPEPKPEAPARPPPQPAAQPIIANLLPWKLSTDPAMPKVSRSIQRLIYRNGKLWAKIDYLKFSMPEPASPTMFVAIDQKTGDCEEILFPQKLGFAGPDFDVTSDSLFVSLTSGQLARYRIAGKTWETIPLPVESSGNVVALNGRVYFADDANLLEIDPETHAIRVLVSSRRNPPENELDSIGGPHSGIFAGWDNKLGVQTARRFYLFDLNKRAWEKIAPPENLGQSAWFLSTNGVQLLSAVYYKPFHQRLVNFSADHTAPELLLEQGVGSPDSEPEPLLGKPRWDWPEPFRLDVPGFFMAGKYLWALQPRRRYQSHAGPQSEEPVQFSDDRNATLFRFGPDTRQPLSAPLEFQKDGQPLDPFITTNGVVPFPKQLFEPPIPPWLVTDKGIVATAFNRNAIGHWFIPMTELEQRWEADRKSGHEKPEIPTTNGVMNKTNFNIR